MWLYEREENSSLRKNLVSLISCRHFLLGAESTLSPTQEFVGDDLRTYPESVRLL